MVALTYRKNVPPKTIFFRSEHTCSFFVLEMYESDDSLQYLELSFIIWNIK